MTAPRWPWDRVRGPFWSPANAISLARLPLALIAVTLYLAGYAVTSGILIAASFATDALDGAVARRTNTISEWGKVLDPVSDKSVFAIVGLLLVSEGLMPIWLLVALVVRDLLIVAGSYRVLGDTRSVPSSNVLGKASTALLAIWMLKQLYWPAETTWLGLGALGWLALMVMVASTAAYVHRHHRSRIRAEQPGFDDSSA